MANVQTTPLLNINNIDRLRNQGSVKSTASSGTIMLAAVLASLDSLDEVLQNDVGLSVARISQMTANDKQHAVLVHIQGGGTISPPLPTQTETTTSPTTEVLPYGTVWLNTTTQQVYQTPGNGTWVLLEDFA